MKTILVPTDFSPCAETALAFAVRLAQQKRSRIILLNIIGISGPAEATDPEEIQVKENQKEETLQRLKTVAGLADPTRQVSYDYCVEEGAVTEGIVNTAKKRGVDLIVMGTKGEGASDDFVLGSMTTGVIEEALCQVLSIPMGMRLNQAIKKICYATNLLQSDMDALRIVAEIAEFHQAELNILHISNDQEEPEQEVNLLGRFMKTIEKEIPYRHLSCELLNGEDVELRLLNYISAGKTDLLVMSSRHRNYFGRLFDPSVTQTVVNLSKIPVLVFHHKKEKRITAS